MSPAATAEINFGSLDMYAAGGGLPEGDYALEFQVMMYQATKQTGQSSGPPRLGVMVSAHSLTDASAEVRTQFYSMGSNADKSFAPNPETGKGLVPVPGGAAASTLNNSTNWSLLLKSLYDSGLPQGIFTNDLTVIDGVRVHLANVPEPEERKGFGGAATGEVAEERKNKTIAVVTEIKEDGKPWEGSGGLPKAGEVAKKATAPKAVVKPGPKAVAKPAPVAAAPAVAEDEEVLTAAITGITTVLEEKPEGCPKLVLKTSVFKAVNGSQGAEMAQKVVSNYFGDDESLNSVLGQLGYKVTGAKVVAA